MEPKKNKIIKIKNKNYNENASNFSEYYITDKITSNSLIDKFKLNYLYIFVSISKNGGLIAMCKRHNILYSKDQSILAKNLIVMHQNGGKKYYIDNSSLFENRYVVSLEFNYKEQLYAFCNDGEIFKIDILKESPKRLNISLRKLENEKVLKAKAFEKGFIILTEVGTIFYLKDIKSADNNTLEFMVSLRDHLDFKNFEECDFLPIRPDEDDENSDIDLLISNPKREGVYLIKKVKISGTEFSAESVTQNYSNLKVNILLINSKNIEKFDTNKKEVVNEDLETKLNEDLRIGPVSGIAMSINNKKIALYVAKKKAVFILPSRIKSSGSVNYKKLTFNIESIDEGGEDDVEINKILNFINKQLLFLSNDCVAICGGRWVLMINEQEISYAEDLNIEKNPNDKHNDNPYVYCKCISEVDGIRIMSRDEILLIRKIPNYIKSIFDIFLNDSNNPEKQLLSSYEKYEDKEPFGFDELRGMKDNLTNAIFNLLKTSGFFYWTEKDKETIEKKELQNFFLNAANYGKSIFGKNEFNFDKFNNICIDLRIINALRNCQDKPRFITYEEFENLNSNLNDGVLKKTMRQLNFKLAFKIAKFLGLPEKDIYLKYAIKKIKKIDVEDTKEANEVFDELMPKLKQLENISYVDIAKKCKEYKNYILAEKFLNTEKSPLVKIPQYLDMRKWDRSIELAIESNDIQAIMVVLDNIYKVEYELMENKKGQNKIFLETVVKYPDIKKPVINYLKKNGKMNDLFEYLKKMNDSDELFYLSLEKFFQSGNIKEREEILKQLKTYKPEKIEKKYYDNFVSDLDYSLKFKKKCVQKGIIEPSDTSNFDNSIYDCFVKVIPKDLQLVENESKNFKFAKRKITILRFKELFKKGEIEEIEKIINDGFKKLDISYTKIAMMFLENGKKEKALEYVLKENNENLFEEKANLLIKLEKYEEAAEVALRIKEQEKFEEIFNSIGSKVRNDVNRQKVLQEIYSRRK